MAVAEAGARVMILEESLAEVEAVVLGAWLAAAVGHNRSFAVPTPEVALVGRRKQDWHPSSAVERSAPVEKIAVVEG